MAVTRLAGSSVEQIITVLLDRELPEHSLEGCHLPMETERSNACDRSSHFLSKNKVCRVGPLSHLSQLWPVHCFFTA